MKNKNLFAFLVTLTMVSCASPSSSSSEGGISIPNDVLMMAQNEPSRMFLSALMMPTSSSRTETVASVDSRTVSTWSNTLGDWSAQYTDIFDFEASGLLRSEGFGTDEARIYAEVDLVNFESEIIYDSGPQYESYITAFENERIVAYYDGSEVFLDLTDAEGFAFVFAHSGIAPSWSYYYYIEGIDRPSKLRFNAREIIESGLLPLFPGGNDQQVCIKMCLDDPSTEEIECNSPCEEEEPEQEPRGPLTQEEIEAFAASILPMFNYNLLQSEISGTKLSITYEATQDDLVQMFETGYLGGYSREDFDEEYLQQLDQWVADAVAGFQINRMFASVSVDLLTSVVESLTIDIDVSTGYSYDGEMSFYNPESVNADELGFEQYPYSWSYSTSYDIEISLETSELSNEIPIALPVNKEEYELIELGYQPEEVYY